MSNPFGEKSESVFAWKERYKQKEFEVQTLQMRVSELKNQFDQSILDYQTISQELEIARSEIIKLKEEYSRISSLLNDQQGVLTNLEQSLETDSMSTLKGENKKYREEIEELQSQLARGGGTSSDLSSDLSATLTPLMMKIFDPNNTRFENAFDNFVNTLSLNGDVFQKIMASLIKRGGSSPIENTKASVDNEQFDEALEYLIENEILKIVDYRLTIITSESSMSLDIDWDKMNTSEVFDFIKSIMEGESDKNVIRSMDLFRDTLQEREVPAKIFFEIRKMSEGISANSMTREEALEQIEDWRRRVGSV
ncbi:MAG: hypothetical protein HeimC2_23080 [Candidatus Heimdallarchaeota archaeon LC_2]|nr:MAG: hypothetical protein HeimC2_23080 [Candidatus Heimdallarchaeota archaeon LC_2]